MIKRGEKKKMIDRGLTSWDLKCLAIATMLIDHVGVVLFPNMICLRIIGRMAFPIFGFLLVQGFRYTHDVKAYNKRLWLFACISEIPFDLAVSGRLFDLRMQNIFFTLALTLFMLRCLEKAEGQYIKQMSILITTAIISSLLHTDYAAIGVFYMAFLYSIQKQLEGPKARLATFFIAFGMIAVQIMGAFPALNLPFKVGYALALAMPIYCYNGKKGRSLKYFFYLFYPVHLLLLYSIHYFM